MSSRPVVSYHGDHQLFKLLEPLLSQALPKEAIEWKRTYGRPPRAVTLNASFEPLLSEMSPGPDKPFNKLLGSQVLHTFWIECPDVDTYKSSIRDNIHSWFSHLKKVEYQDWLIILVETPDSKKGNKILPRTTVIDKVKNDFGGKTPERCVTVLDPVRGEIKTSESWQTFLFRFRQALMAAFSRTLTKFEEVVRTQREHRNEPNWNFCNYFLLQEELAFVFEMLGLHDEALVQYDELDALFTQFVLNSAVGDAPSWLSSFQVSPNDWSGVCLRPDNPFNLDLRKKIQKHTMSVIDFRNYLFSRQSSLLLITGKPAEVARRCLSFVQSCPHEIKLLNIHVIEGAITTWILLSCLQVLSTCQTFVASTSSHQAMEHFALLWNVAKDKLYELGRQCGLLPDGTVGSSELHHFVTLSSGISDYHDDSITRPSPIDKFKDALSSKQSFTKHYLELSELAMGTFKHCGRLRSARLIGRDLSRFYVQLGQPQKSVNFLLELLRGYQEENWYQLKVDTHMELAEVYRLIGDHDRFVETSANIATYKPLNLEIRMKYFDHLISSAQDHMRLINCAAMLDLLSVQIDYDTSIPEPFAVLCDSTVKAHIEIMSHFPGPVQCHEIYVTLKKNPTEDKMIGKKLTEKPSTAPALIEANSNNKLSNATIISDLLPIKEQLHLKQDGSLSSVALVYLNVNQVLGRKISRGFHNAETTAIKEEHSNKFIIENVTIQPGMNRLSLQMKADCEGSFSINQIVVRSHLLEFIQKINCPGTPNLSVVEVTPTVTIAHPPNDILAGIEQEIKLVIRAGSIAFDKEMDLKLCTSRGLSVRLSGDSVFRRELDLHLEPLSSFDTITYNLSILADLISTKDNSSTEHKLTLECPWLTKPTHIVGLSLHVSAPFSVQYRLHTSHSRKFVNIHIQGLTPRNRTFEFENPTIKLPEATFANPLLGKLDWKNLNGSNRLMISQEQPVNYLWELCGIPPQVELPVLKGEFTVKFRLVGNEEWRNFSHFFDIADYSTLYTMRSRVDPVKGNDFLRAGSLCHLTLTITNVLQIPTTAALMYEVLADQTMWAVCGRSAGVFSMEGASKHNFMLDVMPLICGYLPLPSVRLSKYIPADQKAKDTNRRSELATTGARLEPFSPGQVYNWSKGEQVHVLAAASTGILQLDNSLP